MTNIALCVGKYAEKPYYIEQIRKNIYSIEELCYYIYQNTSFLDNEIMREDLVIWLDEECGLKELAKKLLGQLHDSNSFTAFVCSILEEAHYVDKTEINLMEGILKESEGLSLLARKKRRADYYVTQERYFAAIDLYERLLEEIPVSDIALRKDLYHNVGCLYGRMFCYETASEYWEKAYEISEDMEDLWGWLYCLKMCRNQKEYEKFVKTQKHYHEAALLLEKKLTELEKKIEQRPDSSKEVEVALKQWKTVQVKMMSV